jgi:flagellar basal-body rod modification protein FlgD
MDISAAAAPTQATSAFSSLTRNVDTFLTLLTTQLKNQDPLEPLDTEKFTSQLVEFASVEQSIRTNSHLEALIALQGAEDRQSAIAFVGKDVTISSDRAALSGGEATWSYTLAAPGAVTISVLNARGETVARSASLAAAGAHAFSWNGVTSLGAAAPDGVYRLVIDAKDANGAAVKPEIETTTRVLAASFREGAPQLETPIGLIALGDVRRFSASGN